MINEALGFKEWIRLNEDVNSKREVYTEFLINVAKSRMLDKSLYRSGITVNGERLINTIRGTLLENEIKKHFPGIEIEQIASDPKGSLPSYKVIGSEFDSEGDNDLILNFGSIERKVKERVEKMKIFDVIQKNSTGVTSIQGTRMEAVLKGELNSLPEEEVLPSIIESAKPEWLSTSVDPSEFKSELESIMVSHSIGEPFFNEQELMDLLSDFLTVVAFEAYAADLIDSTKVKRTIFDLDNLTSDLEERLNRFKSKMKDESIANDDAVEILDFIKYLTFKLRPKGGKVKLQADRFLAEILTAVETAGLTKKIMDVL